MPSPSPPPRPRHLILCVVTVLSLLLLPSANAFFPRSPSSSSPTTIFCYVPQPDLGLRLITPSDTSFLSTYAGVRILFVAATGHVSAHADDGSEDEWVESPCPCTELGVGSGAAGPLTDRCDLGDVVVLVLSPSLPGAPSPLALAVVDGPNEVCLLCMRSLKWYRDCRDEIKVLTDVSSAALVRVLSNATYSPINIPSNGGRMEMGNEAGAAAVDCWLIDEKDLPDELG